MRCNFIKSAAVCIAAANPVAATERHDAPLMIDTIALWLLVNFGLPVSAQAPALVGVSAAELVAMRYGPDNAAPAGDVIAVYDEGTIFLAHGWTGRTAAELSILVHEMVHHLQSSAEMRFACPGEREVLAYRAQDAWLGLFGESLESAFGIDPAMIVVGTACTH
jgi:hypothetical protein